MSASNFLKSTAVRPKDTFHPVLTASTTIYDSSIATVYPISLNSGAFTVTFAPPQGFASRTVHLVNISTVFTNPLTIVANTVSTAYPLIYGGEKFTATSDGAKWTIVKQAAPRQGGDLIAAGITATVSWTTIPADGACVPVTATNSAIVLTLPAPGNVNVTDGPSFFKLVFVIDATQLFTVTATITGCIATKATSTKAYSGATGVIITDAKAGDELLIGTDGITWFVSGSIMGVATASA